MRAGSAASTAAATAAEKAPAFLSRWPFASSFLAEAKRKSLRLRLLSGLVDLAAVACKALHNLLLDATTGATTELLGAATHGRLLDTLGELVAVADDDDFLAAAGALRTILEE